MGQGSQEAETIVIERNGSIVAAGALVGNEIFAVFIEPAYQGQGYRKTMMRELEGRAKAKDFDNITIIFVDKLMERV